MSSGVLFIHNNFPGQFRNLATALVARGVRCAAIGSATSPGVQGVRIGRYALDRGSTPGVFPYAVRAEADLIRGANALRIARALKDEGFEPEAIVGHPGWGEMVFLDEVWPNARQVMFSEFFYRAHGLDVDFDTEFHTTTEDVLLTAHAKSAVMALSLASATAIVSPTPFQASALPAVFRPLVRIIHEGVDIEAIRPGPPEPLVLPDGRTILPGTPVITYANNHMEPMRGLHIFARALPRLMDQVPEAQVLVFGQDSAHPYGGLPEGGGTWRELIFRDLQVDPSRLHFMGKTPHETLLAALRLSTAHVYYTYPFVLSWSLVEALASGCYVIGSDTAPLRDAIEDGVNGRLLSFFDPQALSAALIEACRNPEGFNDLRAAARATAVAKFSKRDGTEAWLGLLRELGVEIPNGDLLTPTV
ncbi:glycosyltransferase [Phenylobacterium sp.]|jgi:glycosyltransferase involved in cell wall biosynthesis|uniref:glycosyltransferase n=1 Tax=Phenylobacterium sp. TaxID=1871053 RepID=UPI002E316FC7|nr:glycosyltransferase [Phenylobacterium sp.]HEX3366953.1 glycosyltransferase [Phenylobacterium sp.]